MYSWTQPFFVLAFVAVVVFTVIGLLYLPFRAARFLSSYLVCVPASGFLAFLVAAKYPQLLAEISQVSLENSVMQTLVGLVFGALCPFYIFLAGAWAGFLLSTTINRSVGLHILPSSSVNSTMRKLSTVVGFATIFSFLPTVASAAIYSTQFTKIVEDAAFGPGHRKVVCIFDTALKPVRSAMGINFWNIVSESVRYKLGLRNSVTVSSGWGRIRQRGIHFGMYSNNKTYSWSFKKHSFEENSRFYGFGPSRIEQIRQACRGSTLAGN